MAPDKFFRFYRFMFSLLKEPRKKHVNVRPLFVRMRCLIRRDRHCMDFLYGIPGLHQVETALAAWQLLLSGRFRLLHRWCDFIKSLQSLRVISEDQWWQILDFSRTVHEDLSNFDPSGAWALLLDDFVEHLRTSVAAERMPSSR